MNKMKTTFDQENAKAPSDSETQLQDSNSNDKKSDDEVTSSVTQSTKENNNRSNFNLT